MGSPPFISADPVRYNIILDLRIPVASAPPNIFSTLRSILGSVSFPLNMSPTVRVANVNFTTGRSCCRTYFFWSIDAESKTWCEFYLWKCHLKGAIQTPPEDCSVNVRMSLLGHVTSVIPTVLATIRADKPAAASMDFLLMESSVNQ